MTDREQEAAALNRSIERMRKYVDAGSIIHTASSYRTSDGVVHLIEFDDLRAVLDAAAHRPTEPDEDVREALANLIPLDLVHDRTREGFPQNAFEVADAILARFHVTARGEQP